MEKLELNKELVIYYIGLTTKAFEKATPLTEKNSEEDLKLQSMLRMAKDYLKDAKYFLENGDLVRAYGAINYSHAWIDAGVRIGLLDGHGDDELFTLP
ncbi:MAG: hypothetical protein CMB64_07415 [Euryarchaeota archaeon]|nr:hypothetical protein [Euryarchaeota archaeon]|tara:strand:- start:2883 stop:3176 length:294 start_codon:yes stop_codon:yes gene_type:complete